GPGGACAPGGVLPRLIGGPAGRSVLPAPGARRGLGAGIERFTRDQLIERARHARRQRRTRRPVSCSRRRLERILRQNLEAPDFVPAAGESGERTLLAQHEGAAVVAVPRPEADTEL